MWRSIRVGKNKSINEKTSYNFTKMIFEKLEKEIEYLSDNMYDNITKRIDETGFFIYCHEHEGNVVSTRNFLITEVKKMLLRNNLNQFRDVIGWNNTFWDYKVKNNMGVL
jgi:prophage tail gpP-like protein